MGQKQQEGKSQAGAEKSRQPSAEDNQFEGLASLLASTLSSKPADEWPKHPTAGPVRQAAILQMQRDHGNAWVQSMLSGASHSPPGKDSTTGQSETAITLPRQRLATPAVQLFPGSRSGRGYRYGGGRSAGYTRTEVNRAIANFERDNLPQLADACRVFLELAPMEGWISAINTWDSQVFTWGAGFAYGGMLNTMWAYLDGSVKSYLASHAARHFPGGRLNITDAIRTDTAALDAVVHVSENDPFRAHVLRAQLRTFMERTMGVSRTPTRGENFATRDTRALSLAAHLRHWTPSFFDMPGDLNSATVIAGGGAGAGATVDPVAIAAAVIQIHAHHMLDSGRFGENRPGRRRVLKASKASSWNPVMRYERNLGRLFTSMTLPSTVSTILPAFQTSVSPYFLGKDRLADLPENHYIMKKGRTYYDFGPRS